MSCIKTNSFPCIMYLTIFTNLKPSPPSLLFYKDILLLSCETLHCVKCRSHTWGNSSGAYSLMPCTMKLLDISFCFSASNHSYKLPLRTSFSISYGTWYVVLTLYCFGPRNSYISLLVAETTHWSFTVVRYPCTGVFCWSFSWCQFPVSFHGYQI